MTGFKNEVFVLKPEGDDIYAEASRKAMRAYAMYIENENEELAKGLREWADSEQMKVVETNK